MIEQKVAKELVDIAKSLTAGSAEQRELELYIVNDGDLYRRQTEPIIKNLQRKIKRDVYDRDKAVKLFMYLVDAGAKKYTKEFDSRDSKWHEVFPKRDREAVAEELRDYYEEEIMEGITASSKKAKTRKAYGEPDWDEEFEVNSFVEKHMDDVEIVGEDDYGDETAKLTRSMQNELKRTYKNFQTEDYSFDGLADEVAKDMEDWISKGNIAVWPGEGETDEQYEKALKKIKVVGLFDQRMDYYAITFRLELDGEKVTFEPDGFYYRDNGDAMYSAIREWDWAAWLGDDDSPMYDQDFVDIYNEIEAYRWFEEASGWQSWDLVEKVQELLEDAGYEPEKVK